MRRTRLKLRKTKVRGEIRWELTIPQKDAGRKRRYFTEKAEAETARDLAKIAQRNFGTAALSISDRLRVEATKAQETLSAYGKTISDAVAFYVVHLEQTSKSRTVKAAVTDLLKARKC